MNTAASSPPDASSPRSLEPVSPEDRELRAEVPSSLTLPEIRREGKDLVLCHGAVLPTRICIRSGRPAFREVEVALRNPRDPRTWFGRRPGIRVGLSRKQYENHVVGLALAWSFLVLGLLLLVAGFLTSGVVPAVLGWLTLVFSGLFRSCSPVICPARSGESVTIRGACPSYLRRVGGEAGSSK